MCIYAVISSVLFGAEASRRSLRWQCYICVYFLKKKKRRRRAKSKKKKNEIQKVEFAGKKVEVLNKNCVLWLHISDPFFYESTFSDLLGLGKKKKRKKEREGTVKQTTTTTKKTVVYNRRWALRCFV